MAVSHDQHSGSIHVRPEQDENQTGTTTTTLASLLANPLLLGHTVDHLPISAALHLAATSRQFRTLLYHTPKVFRRLDLSTLKSAQFDIDPIDQGGETWPNVQLDEHVAEDEYVLGISNPTPSSPC